MKKLRNFLMIGAAAAAVAAGPALAQSLKYHDMTVRSPDGAVAHIRYTGDTPPKIRFDTPSELAAFSDTFDSGPFIEMDRISAAMDREAAALWRASVVSDPLTFASPQQIQARLGHLPPGTEGYSIVSFTTGGKTCTEKMAYSYDGHGKPLLQKASTGDCGAGAAKDQAPLKVKAQSPVAHTLKHDWQTIEAAL